MRSLGTTLGTICKVPASGTGIPGDPMLERLLTFSVFFMLLVSSRVVCGKLLVLHRVSFVSVEIEFMSLSCQ